MVKVSIHSTMTLDGFMARPNNEIDWAVKYSATGGKTSLRFRVVKERVVGAVEECVYSTAVKMNKLSNI